MPAGATAAFDTFASETHTDIASTPVVDVHVVDVLEVIDAAPDSERRAATRSSPPPVPSAEKRKRATTLAMAEQIAKDIDEVALADPVSAAALAYAFGERCERKLGDEETAIAAFRRAFTLDSSLRPTRWALRCLLYRRSLWPELVALIDAEVSLAVDDHERVDLLFERAVVSGHHGADDQARIALDHAVTIAPLHQGALLELERVVTRTGDRSALVDVWERLADASEQPERRIAYWLEVARACAAHDYGRSQKAFDAAGQLAFASRPGGVLAERVAREQLRIADQHGTPGHVVAAIETLAQMLQLGAHARVTEPRRELVALRRRQAQLARAERPLHAWEYLQQALALAPQEPVLLVDLVELAGELGRTSDLPKLLHLWHAVLGEAERAMMLSAWCAEAHLRSDRREPMRALLGALEATAPGFVLLTSTAECGALADPKRVRSQRDLATSYLAAANAAVLGSWLGPGMARQPDPNAAVAYYVQAADLLAYYLGTPAALTQARDALGKALVAVPSHPAVLEALIELDDATGHAEDALARLREMAGAALGNRLIVERAIRLARSHGLLEAVLELERTLCALEPEDYSLAWRLESTLFELGRDAERAALLRKLGQTDTDPARRRTALLGVARFDERAGDASAAIDGYRQLLAAWPHDGFTRDALIGLLRSQRRWLELVTERRAEARVLSDVAVVRRALREAAWVLEVWLADTAQAAEVYDEWLARLPSDRTALEGIARCRAALGDHAGEITARAAIAELDQTTDARWLHARSLERAARYVEAAEQYRGLVAAEDSRVAATSATLAIGDLAARGDDIGMRVDAADALAKCTSDPGLGAALFEDSGWMSVLALEDFDRATQAFTAALALQPTRRGALLGATLLAARDSDPIRLVNAYGQLAANVGIPEATVALLLRAAAIATASGNVELANDRIAAAWTAGPENASAVVLAAELVATQRIDTTDPFAAVDRLVARAAILEQRAALTDDPVARASWELDRAEALELAGQLREAGAIIAAVLQITPDDRRALSTLRRIAKRVGDRTTWAQASYALARQSRDPGFRMRMLRDAVDVYDQPGPAKNPGYAITIYRRLVAVEPRASESERLVELLRERGDAGELIEALSDRLAALAAKRDEPAMIPLLLERSTLLESLACHEAAMRDLDALLEHAPNNLDALRLRADLAIKAGDVDLAASLWWRFLAIETAGPRRAEIELLLVRALKNDADVAAPPEPKPSEAAGDGWDQEPTEAAPPVVIDVAAGSPVNHGDPFAATTAVAPAYADLFDTKTVVADLSELQAQERREARIARGERDPVVKPEAPARQTGERPIAVPTEIVRERSAASPRKATADDALAAAVGASDLEAPTPVAESKPWPPILDRAELAKGNRTEVRELEPSLAGAAIAFPDEPELSPDDSAVVMLSYDKLQPSKATDASADALLQQCEREIALVDDPASALALRIEAGRLCETLRHADRAHAHYEAALVVDPRATPALRGLRRIAWTLCDLVEVTRLVDAELAVAGDRERAPLVRYRIDLLMATGEQDIARVAVGELLDAAPLDISALLAHLELAFLDGRADEFGKALELLARAVTDTELRGAVQAARAVLAAHHGDTAAATQWFAAAGEADPTSPASRLGAIRHAAAQGHGEAARVALLDLACNVEGGDPIIAAALAVRAQLWNADPNAADSSRETIVAAAQLAARCAPRDPLVARIATETAFDPRDPRIASHAFARWARCKSAPVERAYAAARAAELEPERLGRLWAQVLELDPGDDYAVAGLRTAYLAAEEVTLAIELDVRTAQDTQLETPLLRAASALIGNQQLTAAIEVLVRGRVQRPGSVPIAEALAEALARAGRWLDRAKLLAEVAAEPGPLAVDVARLRSALAWDKAVPPAVPDADDAARSAVETVTLAALEAWRLVLANDPQSPVAHAAAIVLARRLDHRGILMHVLTRAQAAERSPWAASSLALCRARLLLGNEPRLAHDVARDATPELDDPRRTLAVMMAAACRQDLGDAATALETRASLLESPELLSSSSEPATLRLRAAQLALDADDAPRATRLLAEIAERLPTMVDDLIDAARRRAGEPATTGTRRQPADSFLRFLRDAELATTRGELATALDLYRRAIEIRPADPLAAAPLVRIATELRDPNPIVALAHDQLRIAEGTGDAATRAEVHELLARVEHELRGDPEAAHRALESASQAAPGRIDLLHRLERDPVLNDRHHELVQLREREVDHIKNSFGDGTHDLGVLIMDAATLGVRDKRSDAELAKLYRAVLDAEPRNRLALFHLESILRRGGFSEDLAAVEERIAGHFDDPRTRAAFLTRAGETLAALGMPVEAVQKFARAAESIPNYQPALDAWHQTALDGGLWVEVAKVATHRARLVTSPGTL